MYYLRILIYLRYVVVDFSFSFFLPYYILLDNNDIAVVDFELVRHS